MPMKPCLNQKSAKSMTRWAELSPNTLNSQPSSCISTVIASCQHEQQHPAQYTCHIMLGQESNCSCQSSTTAVHRWYAGSYRHRRCLSSWPQHKSA